MFLKLFFTALPIFIAFDISWVGFLAKDFYRDQIGFLMKPNINWLATIFFYFLFITGLVLFVIQPALEKHSWTHTLLFGAIFGLVTYATFDLTNLALLKNWPVLVTIIDLIWGMFLSALVSLLTYFIAVKMFA
ncbi:MAG: DUF2177 family protein [Bacteroidota bacterium]